MKNYMLASALTASALMAAPALAEDAAGPVTLSANTALVSDYRFRGVSLSDKDPAIQGGLNINHESGFYVGTWGSSIEQFNGAEAELDIFAGWSGDLGGVTFDVGGLGYVYPGGSNTDYWELYAAASKSFGPVGTKLGVAYAPDQSNIGSKDNVYVYGDLSYAVPETPVTLKAHLGYEDGAFGGPDGNKLDWSLGVDFAYRQFTLGIAYVDTDISNIGIAKAGFVVSLGAKF